MLQPVHVGHKSLADYTHIAGRELIEEIRELAEPLQGKRVLARLARPRSAAASREILYTLVPLMRDVGLDADWQVIYGREEFFNATKLMHNALQGDPQDLDRGAVGDLVDGYNEMNARELARRAGTCASSTTRSRRRCCGLAPREGARLDLALPHRPLDAEPGDDRAPAARTSRDYAALGLPHAGLRARAGMGGTRPHRAAGDRPALAEEHGALARGRGLRLRAVRDRRRPAADAARSRASTRGRTRSA